MRFSVIIPTYNYAQYLPRALDSVLGQQGDDFEIVVVDDGSTDETANIINQYLSSNKYPLRYYYHENRGLAATRNQGVRLSHGAYMFFLDADDALMPNALHLFRNVLREHDHLDFIIGGRIWVDPAGKEHYRFVKTLSSSRERNFSDYLSGRLGRISPGTLIVHKQVFTSIQFPEDARFGEDRIFNAHLLARYTGITFREPIVRLFRHADSLSQDSELTRRHRLITVDLVFNPAILPTKLMTMRDEVLSHTYLAMFVFFYRRGEYYEARPLYHQAIRSYPRHILKWKHLRKYLRVCLAFMRMEPAS
jgi:glycosyltransferase involved in cell wall biosynthesis